jgi:hypothetical protein
VVRSDGTLGPFVLGPSREKKIAALGKKVRKNKNFADITRRIAALA